MRARRLRSTTEGTQTLALEPLFREFGGQSTPREVKFEGRGRKCRGGLCNAAFRHDSCPPGVSERFAAESRDPYPLRRDAQAEVAAQADRCGSAVLDACHARPSPVPGPASPGGRVFTHIVVTRAVMASIPTGNAASSAALVVPVRIRGRRRSQSVPAPK